jgi:hypothetical protein
MKIIILINQTNKMNILCESNLRIIVSIKVFCGAVTCPRFIGIFSEELYHYLQQQTMKRERKKHNRLWNVRIRVERSDVSSDTDDYVREEDH